MIVLASSNVSILSAWGVALTGEYSVTVAASLDDLMHKQSALKPEFVIFDPDLLGNDPVGIVRRIRSDNPKTRLVLLTGASYQSNDAKDLALLRAGVRGFCNVSMDKKTILKVLDALTHGQIWVRQSLIPALIEQLSKHPHAEANQTTSPPHEGTEIPSTTVSDRHLDLLTRREREIAIMIGQGECNKNIADQLDISERTVKAHLTTIFRKLNIPDRVHLALLVSKHESNHSPAHFP